MDNVEGILQRAKLSFPILESPRSPWNRDNGILLWIVGTHRRIS